MRCPPGGDIKEDFATGLAGHNLAQSFVGLQSHKAMMEMAHKWAERANRIGWEHAGIDVARIDADTKAAGEDLDSSINLSGDHHYHYQSEPPTAKQPPQPAPQKPNGMPTWAKWALAAAIAASGLGPAATAYFLSNQQSGGGSIFAFDTELPAWMEPDSSPD